MLIRITVRNFTGASFALDVETATTVADLKQQIAAAGKGKSTRLHALSFKDHELRDSKQLHHYNIVARDIIHIRETSSLYFASLQLL
jgi:hypothetical protein